MVRNSNEYYLQFADKLAESLNVFSETELALWSGGRDLSDQYIHEQRPDYDSFSRLKMEIEDIKKQISAYDQDINNIHQQISSAIKDITYLTILQNRVEDTLANSQNIGKVLQMLDKSPQTIHYDKDDIYFDMLEKWNQSHDMNVFQNYIMQSENEFFSA